MLMRRKLLPALAVLAASCGAPPSPGGLAYGPPGPAPLIYVTGDTLAMDIDAGGQAMAASVRRAATMDVAFAPAAAGVEVSLTYRDFAARMTQPMGGPVTADGSGIGGPIVFTLDAQGRVGEVTQPEITGNARQFVRPLTTAATFFPRLPGRAMDAGATWTDTIRIEGSDASGRVSSVKVVTSTVVGDTTVAGLALLKVVTEGTEDSSSSGVIAGMDFSQDVRGDVEGWFLWDGRRGVVVESYEQADLRGDMDVSAAPFPLTVRIRSQSIVRLADGM